jgi:hypothetical protein
VTEIAFQQGMMYRLPGEGAWREKPNLLLKGKYLASSTGLLKDMDW